MSHNSELTSWVESHNSDYSAVVGRLSDVRNKLLTADINVAADILAKAYDFAVLSIRTELERHERAFTARYAAGVSRKEAALMTVYGGHKKNWMRRTHENTDWVALAESVRYHVSNRKFADLLDVIVDNLVGVSYRKGAFMLAMSGLTEFGCIDSNVGRYAGIDPNDDWNSGESYMKECNEIFAETGLGGWDNFVIQWMIYDFERGEHARHMAYFTEVLP